jgi:hypothetical protein
MASKRAGQGRDTERPRTRLGGEIRIYAGGVRISLDGLEEAVREAGYRLTPRGEGYVQAMRDLTGKVA